jgi:hypothetical protein
MLILRRRQARNSTSDRPVSSPPKPAVIVEFLEELQNGMKPLIRPVRELQANVLGVDVRSLQWLDARPDPLSRYRSEEQSRWVEVFQLENGLLVVNARIAVERSNAFTLIVSVMMPTTEAADQLLDRVSAIAESSFGIKMVNLAPRSEKFETSRSEVATEDLPHDENSIMAAKALEDRRARSLAVSIKSSRGLLAKDVVKLVDPKDASEVIDNLVASGIAVRDVVVVCGSTQTQVARVPNKESLSQLSAVGLRCACGKSIDQEMPDDLLTVTDLGVLLLDESRWMSIVVREELAALGVNREDILLECQLGADEIDCIALISGQMVIFELKDKEFSTGNAYSFSAKISLVNPDFSVIVTTDKVAADVKKRFSRVKSDPRGRLARAMDDVASIQYVEGDDFCAGLRRVVSEIYRVYAGRILQGVLESVTLEAGSVLKAISKSMDSESPVFPTEEPDPTMDNDSDIGEYADDEAETSESS